MKSIVFAALTTLLLLALFVGCAMAESSSGELPTLRERSASHALATEPEPAQTIPNEPEQLDDAAMIERLSTYERPTLEEFDWYDQVNDSGVWQDAAELPMLPYLLGGWKCLIVYDPYRNMDSYARELANVEIQVAQSGLTLTLDWYQMLAEGEPPYDETDLEDALFSGQYDGADVVLIGPGNIMLGDCYAHQGAYYCLGTLLTPDGVVADFCLMR